MGHSEVCEEFFRHEELSDMSKLSFMYECYFTMETLKLLHFSYQVCIPKMCYFNNYRFSFRTKTTKL